LAATAGAQTNVPSITAAEYFIGTDPGAGLATSIPLATSNSIVGVTEEVNVNVSGLEAGTYSVGVRFQDATGQWGNPVYQRFTVYPSDYQGQIPGPEGPAATLSAAECFLGPDPGPGNGSPLPLAEAGRITSLTTELPINISSLVPGTYSLGVRFQSADGVWGNPVYQRFTIYPDNYELAAPTAPADNNSLKVAAAEYFVGNDPGPGNGTQVPVADAATLGAVENISVPVGNLSQGHYRVGVRFKSVDGRWGNPLYAGFSIYDIFEAPVNHPPSSILLSSLNILEGIASGTVVAALSTADPDGDVAFVYSLVPGIGSDDNALFSIQGGFLKTAGNVDYESRPARTASIRVRSADSSGAFVEVPFSLTVLNATSDDDAVLAAWKGGGGALTSELLSKYAIGGAASPTQAGEPLSSMSEGGFFSLLALVRTNDGSLSIIGETSPSVLGPWTTDSVFSTTMNVSQSGAPAGFERRKFSIPEGNQSRFLRLKAVR